MLLRASVLFAASALSAQTPAVKVDAVKVIGLPVERKVELPGEFLPYQQTAVRARLTGFVVRVMVDRGSHVKEGDVLAIVAAPEMDARIAEAKARVGAMESQVAEARARVAAAQSTSEKLKTANQTPGAVSGNELVQATNVVAAEEARVKSAQGAVDAANANVAALEETRKYLQVTAPFSGVITTRYVHPGALVGASMGPLFDLEQQNRLRLVVSVPERDAGSLPRKGRLSFKVPAHPLTTFEGTVARSSGVVDPKSRTMAVELDVMNPKGLLSPGMYPTVSWVVASSGTVLLVPPGAVVSNTERTFVNRIRNGRVEWVDVVKGASVGDRVEVRSTQLFDGDVVARRGTDELRSGTKVEGRLDPKAR